VAGGRNSDSVAARGVCDAERARCCEVRVVPTVANGGSSNGDSVRRCVGESA